MNSKLQQTGGFKHSSSELKDLVLCEGTIERSAIFIKPHGKHTKYIFNFMVATHLRGLLQVHVSSVRHPQRSVKVQDLRRPVAGGFGGNVVLFWSVGGFQGFNGPGSALLDF